MVHRPRKRFGQNFLQSHQVIDTILREFHAKPTDHVIEIGPGLGALTKPLLRKLPHLLAIEIDRDLHLALSEMSSTEGQLELICADALSIDYSQFGNNLRIIGNLPYNISTPLLFHLLHHLRHIQDMTFMLQKEVVDRLCAQPGSKAYGRLSVMIQYFCEAECLFNVPKEAFFPQPKVESAIVRLVPYTISPYPEIDFLSLERLLQCAFSMRRKTLANNLKHLLSASDLITLGIEPSLRPEQISITDYVQIAKFINN